MTHKNKCLSHRFHANFTAQRPSRARPVSISHQYKPNNVPNYVLHVHITLCADSKQNAITHTQTNKQKKTPTLKTDTTGMKCPFRCVLLQPEYVRRPNRNPYARRLKFHMMLPFSKKRCLLTVGRKSMTVAFARAVSLRQVISSRVLPVNRSIAVLMAAKAIIIKLRFSCQLTRFGLRFGGA